MTQAATHMAKSAFHSSQGFTLIEVLISLAILAISLTAIVKATSSNIDNTRLVEERNISHWVQMHAISMLQLKLIPIGSSVISQQTEFLGQIWYWRAKVQPTASPFVKQVTLRVSKDSSGPFRNPLTAYLSVEPKP